MVSLRGTQTVVPPLPPYPTVFIHLFLCLGREFHKFLVNPSLIVFLRTMFFFTSQKGLSTLPSQTLLRLPMLR